MRFFSLERNTDMIKFFYQLASLCFRFYIIILLSILNFEVSKSIQVYFILKLCFFTFKTIHMFDYGQNYLFERVHLAMMFQQECFPLASSNLEVQV